MNNICVGTPPAPLQGISLAAVVLNARSGQQPSPPRRRVISLSIASRSRPSDRALMIAAVMPTVAANTAAAGPTYGSRDSMLAFLPSACWSREEPCGLKATRNRRSTVLGQVAIPQPLPCVAAPPGAGTALLRVRSEGPRSGVLLPDSPLHAKYSGASRVQSQM